LKTNGNENNNNNNNNNNTDNNAVPSMSKGWPGSPPGTASESLSWLSGCAEGPRRPPASPGAGRLCAATASCAGPASAGSRRAAGAPAGSAAEPASGGDSHWTPSPGRGSVDEHTHTHTHTHTHKGLSHTRTGYAVKLKVAMLSGICKIILQTT